MKITLWVKPSGFCPMCDMTQKEFNKRGIIYTTRKLTPKAVDKFLNMGLTSAPIVETDDRRWSGFRLSRIESLDNHLKFERKRGVNVPLVPMVQVADEVSDE